MKRGIPYVAFLHRTSNLSDLDKLSLVDRKIKYHQSIVEIHQRQLENTLELKEYLKDHMETNEAIF